MLKEMIIILLAKRRNESWFRECDCKNQKQHWLTLRKMPSQSTRFENETNFFLIKKIFKTQRTKTELNFLILNFFDAKITVLYAVIFDSSAFFLSEKMSLLRYMSDSIQRDSHLVCAENVKKHVIIPDRYHNHLNVNMNRHFSQTESLSDVFKHLYSNTLHICPLTNSLSMELHWYAYACAHI